MDVAPIQRSRELARLQRTPGFRFEAWNMGMVVKSNKWGNAICGKFNDMRAGNLLANINKEDIDRVFNLPVNATEGVKQKIVQALFDLLDLQTGRELVARAIRKCVSNRQDGNVGIYQICFSCEDDEYSFGRSANDRHRCVISLESGWNSGQRFEDSVPMLLGGEGGNGVSFAGVTMSDPLSLAHEFGHALYYLETPLRDDDDNWWEAGQERAEVEYGQIFSGIVNVRHGDPPIPAYTSAEDLFISCWNHGEFLEALNILDDSSMLHSSKGRLRVSDGILIKEALDGPWPIYKKPKFFDREGGEILVYHDGLPPTRFIRFGHTDWGWFSDELLALDEADMREFLGLIAKLSNKITTTNKGHQTSLKFYLLPRAG